MARRRSRGRPKADHLDLAQVVLAGRNYRIEDVGVMADGGALFAVYVALMQAVS